MQKILVLCGLFIVIALIFAVAFGISACIFWGLGKLIVLVFKINYIWTFWHGLVCALIFAIIKSIFTKN